MSKKDEVMKLALEALEPRPGMPNPEYESLTQCAITALREALAEQPAHQHSNTSNTERSFMSNNEQSKALRLADSLEFEWRADALNYDTALNAAAELRRLHAELASIKQAITDPENQPSQFGTVTMEYMQREVKAMTAAAPDLLAELQNIANADPRKWDEETRDQFQQWAQNRARAAIAKATGGAV